MSVCMGPVNLKTNGEKKDKFKIRFSKSLLQGLVSADPLVALCNS